MDRYPDISSLAGFGLGLGIIIRVRVMVKMAWNVGNKNSHTRIATKFLTLWTSRSGQLGLLLLDPFLSPSGKRSSPQSSAAVLAVLCFFSSYTFGKCGLGGQITSIFHLSYCTSYAASLNRELFAFWHTFPSIQGPVNDSFINKQIDYMVCLDLWHGSEPPSGANHVCMI